MGKLFNREHRSMHLVGRDTSSWANKRLDHEKCPQLTWLTNKPQLKPIPVCRAKKELWGSVVCVPLLGSFLMATLFYGVLQCRCLKLGLCMQFAVLEQFISLTCIPHGGSTDCFNSNIWSKTHSWNFLAVWFKRRLLFPLFVLTRKSIHLKDLLIPFLQSTIATCISL